MRGSVYVMIAIKFLHYSLSLKILHEIRICLNSITVFGVNFKRVF